MEDKMLKKYGVILVACTALFTAANITGRSFGVTPDQRVFVTGVLMAGLIVGYLIGSLTNLRE